ncbi:glycosyl hydrolase family 61-domain-containing protein [Melampsora americana]|nr:glycosyl hydrolase family 61-domain-containing protein [Melampsora americana]
MGHVFIKSWKSSSEDKFQPAQKQSPSNTAYRGAADNSGWIGSQFLANSRAIVCGASSTPFGQIKPPGGKFFSDASEAVAKTLTVEAGGKVTLVTANDPGKGFPHPKGHIQAYLGYCGKSATACEDFDASSTTYFKIQESKNGVQDKLRPAMNYDLDGNVWEVPIPAEVPQGSYIFRFEIIAFDQSNAAEGHQDQYYPSCGQLYVKSSQQPSTTFQGVKFPGTYANGNVQQDTLPGPSLMQKSNDDSSKVSAKVSVKSKVSDGDKSTDDSPKVEKLNPEPFTTIGLPDSAPSCAKKSTDCAAHEGRCLCSKKTFVEAYKTCARDHCEPGTSIGQCNRFVYPPNLSITGANNRSFQNIPQFNSRNSQYQ